MDAKDSSRQEYIARINRVIDYIELHLSARLARVYSYINYF